MRARSVITSKRRKLDSAVLGMAQGQFPWWWQEGEIQNDARRRSQLDIYAILQSRFVRIDFGWNSVQPDNASTFNWAWLDKIIGDIVARGLLVLPVLHRTPGWAGNPSTANFAAFATFCAAGVTRYKNVIQHWEVWNEPNLSGFWPPAPDPVAFTDMLKAVYPAMKAADKNCVVILGGLSPVPNNTALPDVYGAREFMTSVYANGGKNFFDHVGYHPYSRPLPPSQNEDWNGWTMMGLANPSIRSIMVANGDSAKDIWVTEYGAPNGTDGIAVTDAGLVTTVAESHQMANTYNWCGPMIWYEYWDSGDNLADSEQNFGILRNDSTIKPAYNTYLHLKRPDMNADSIKFRQNSNGYTGTVDTQINEASPGTAYGTAATIETSLNMNGTGLKSQGLLRFDNMFGNGAGQIPLGATIVAAVLKLWNTADGHSWSPHRMLVPWTSSSTWTSMNGGVSINGVEANNNPGVVAYWAGAGTHTFEVTADVRTWSAGNPNYGWVIEPALTDISPISSAEGVNPPELAVTYITKGEFSGDWLNEISNFGVWLTLSDPAVISASTYDLMIVDPDEQTAGEMPTLRARSGQRPRKLAAYLSVGEAVNYRWYWQSAWNSSPPTWLGTENPSWPGAFRVRYWEEEWKNIIYKSGATSSLGRILAAGFDAVFLDVVDTYAHWESQGRVTAADEMVQFVTELTEYARGINPDFKIIAQNSAPLLVRPDYLSAIDAVSSESMWYAGEVPRTQGDLDWLLPKIASARNAGKRILNIEYTDEQDQINTIYANNIPLKHLTYIAPISLNVLWTRTPT